EARVESGDRARFTGDWEKAIIEYQIARDSSPDPDIQIAALLGIGRTQYQAGDYQAAIDTLLFLLENNPLSIHAAYAHFALAQSYFSLEKYNEATEAYSNYLNLRPGLIDAYAHNLRGDAFRAAGNIAEALVDYRTAIQSPSYLYQLQIEIKIARAHAAVGDHSTALGMYQDIYNQTSSDYTKAQMDYLMGQSYLALGQVEQAYAVYTDAVNNYPIAYESYLALLDLVNAGIPVDELNRGIVDYYAGQYGVALAAFDRYFQSGAIDPATAHYYNGLTTRALGGHDGDIIEWNEIIHNYPDDRLWDDAWEQIAYTQWFFMDNYAQAIQTLQDFVETAPNHPRAPEFLFDAAVIAERADRLEQAADLWERVAVEYPGYEKTLYALHLSGVTRYRLSDYSGAFAIFQHVLANAITLEERSAGYLWQGKAQKALGDNDAATAAWELAANIDPTGYYSERARDLLRGQPPFTPPQVYDLSFDPVVERAQAESWIRTTFDLPDTVNLSSLDTLANDPRLVRGAELWELGLYEEARIELEDLRHSVENDPADSYRLANYYAELGLYRSSILAARQVLDLAGMDDAGTMNAPIFFNHLRFGTYFSELVVPIAQQYEIHPLFLFSVIRQESAFEGFVHSSAGARGLMQIIPTTGQEVANELGWPYNYTNEDLYRPVVSVRLGTDYLDKWRDHLDGDLYAALAAYNGGPGNAIEWQRLAQDDPDLFLEVVRFEETREYIRGIFEIFNIYRRIYNRTP
ncbi:MAG: transglycosylase SLT domain-containing protein, partial [Anaerolineales bacterium]|nr:transglycosylase SLT domain-containing protein [Anaerolineales bacterium]